MVQSAAISEGNAIVLGGAGNLGQALLDLLVADGKFSSITSIDVMPHQHRGGSPVACVVGDILHPESLDDHLRGADVVFHLASMISILPVVHPRYRPAELQPH